MKSEEEETFDDLNRTIDHDQLPNLLLIWRVLTWQITQQSNRKCCFVCEFPGFCFCRNVVMAKEYSIGS